MDVKKKSKTNNTFEMLYNYVNNKKKVIRFDMLCYYVCFQFVLKKKSYNITQ